MANICDSSNLNLMRFPSTSNIRRKTKLRLDNRMAEQKELLQLFALNTNLEVEFIYLIHNGKLLLSFKRYYRLCIKSLKE